MGCSTDSDAARVGRRQVSPGRGDAARGRLLRGILLASCLLLSLAPASALALPDGRAWEQVSPPDKHGASVAPLGEGFEGPSGGLAAASEDGKALTYAANSPVEAHPEANRALEGTQVLAKRTETPSPAWSSQDIATPHAHAEGLEIGAPQEYQLFSPQLDTALLIPHVLRTNPFMEPPLVEGKESEELSVYRRITANCEAGKGCYEAVVNSENDVAHTSYGGKLEYEGASPDLRHAVFVSPVPLTSPPEAEQLYESFPENPPAEQLKLISVLPAGTKPPPSEQAAPPALGAFPTESEGGKAARNAVSSDGSRVFWTASVEAKPEVILRHLFMRDARAGVTVRLDAPVEGAHEEPLNEEEFAAKRRMTYQDASADGSRIFFTSNVSFTPTSKVKPKEEANSPTNLYVCEIPTNVPVTEATKCKLHDLTAGFKGGVGGIVGMVSGVSDDGKTVYFVANGAPEEEGAQKGNCPLPGSGAEVTAKQHCNLYVAKLNGEEWEAPKRIAELSGLDAPDWGRGTGTETGLLTARTSPSGQWFAYMSERTLPGYDNTDLNPLAHGAHDEEVFLYDSAPGGGAPKCVSCNPNPSQRPRGVFDQKAAGEGEGLVVDPFAHVWESQWLAGSIPAWTSINKQRAPYQSRYLLDNGRLYFTSADSLAPHSVETRKETVEGVETDVGVENVYQYEPEGVGSCEAGKGACVSLISSGTSEHESGFLDASTTGNDVFFLTAAQLVPSDLDPVFDAYDARVCSTKCVEPAPLPTRPCASESSCRPGGGTPPPSFQSAPSSTFTGPGNTAKVEVLGSITKHAKPLTKAQKLAKVLAACRKKHKHSRGKRMSCERRARHAYGAAKKGKRK